jgi:formamidopyrimidine-DNA glycosylase
LAGENGQLGLALRMPVVELMTTQQEQSLRAALGPDPLRHDWDPAEAERRLRAAGDRPLVAALLDQRNLAGLGNLWVNELLFVRGLYPWTPAADADLALVVRLAARMLRQSITVRGNGQVTTGNPRAGYEHWVYGRTGQSCRRCLTPVRHTPEVPGDPARRATWWCPHCQPAPDRV